MKTIDVKIDSEETYLNIDLYANSKKDWYYSFFLSKVHTIPVCIVPGKPPKISGTIQGSYIAQDEDEFSEVTLEIRDDLLVRLTVDGDEVDTLNDFPVDSCIGDAVLITIDDGDSPFGLACSLEAYINKRVKSDFYKVIKEIS